LPDLADAPLGSEVLTELRSGRRDTLDRVMPVVYDQLRAIAHRQLEQMVAECDLETPFLDTPAAESFAPLFDAGRAAEGRSVDRRAPKALERATTTNR
jgi:hypothetical protein